MLNSDVEVDSVALDPWAEWQLTRRYGGDPEQCERYQKFLDGVRDEVLDHAGLMAGDVLLDVGTGDGLIAFGALPRVGAQGRVIFSDISQCLLDYCYAKAETQDVLAQCEFVRASADTLSAFNGVSVDAVTTRAVLIYVENKQRALRQFYRVLRPGGRVSICEPISSFAFPEPAHIFRGYNVRPVHDLAQMLHELYARLQPDDSDPMLDFDERDLLTFTERAGFREIYMHVDVAIRRRLPMRWETFLRTAHTPHLPTLQESMAQLFAPAEIEAFTAHLRPLVEAGEGIARRAMAYIWAVKP